MILTLLHPVTHGHRYALMNNHWLSDDPTHIRFLSQGDMHDWNELIPGYHTRIGLEQEIG